MSKRGRNKLPTKEGCSKGKRPGPEIHKCCHSRTKKKRRGRKRKQRSASPCNEQCKKNLRKDQYPRSTKGVGRGRQVESLVYKWSVKKSPTHQRRRKKEGKKKKMKTEGQFTALDENVSTKGKSKKLSGAKRAG